MFCVCRLTVNGCFQTHLLFAYAFIKIVTRVDFVTVSGLAKHSKDDLVVISLNFI